MNLAKTGFIQNVKRYQMKNTPTCKDVVWICTYCSNQQTVGWYEEMKLFKMYMDDIICPVGGDPDEYLKFANSLPNNLQFTLEKVNMEGDLVNINVSTKSNITCHRFQKPTDTGIMVNFCSCAPLQLKKDVIQGTFHSVFDTKSIA